MAVQARRLESELDMRLAALAKLCSGADADFRRKGETGLAAEQVHLLLPTWTLIGTLWEWPSLLPADPTTCADGSKQSRRNRKPAGQTFGRQLQHEQPVDRS